MARATTPKTTPNEKVEKVEKVTPVSEETVVVEQPKVKKTMKELRKLLSKDTEVMIMNNTNGRFGYFCPKTYTQVTMQSYGDVETVSLELLQTMKNMAKSILTNYWVVIVDTIPADEIEEEIDIDDILTYLGLVDLYEGIENYDTTEFFDKLIKKADAYIFEKAINNMGKALLVLFAERCVALYREGQFDSTYKINLLQNKLGLEDLFADVD